MNNELMMSTEILIKDKKKLIYGTVVRAAILAASKVIQVRTADLEDYYLIYFKKAFIFGDKLKSISSGSFIDHSFQNGLVIETSHPILPSLSPNKMVTIPSRNKLFPQLQAHYSPQEIAYIATTLDSFFEKTILAKHIEEIYFTHKRNGQYFKAYQILQILAKFMPKLKSVKERMSSREFNSAHDFYHSSSLPAILKKDPLYGELYCFENRDKPDVRIIFEEVLKSKESYAKLILLWLEKVKRSQDPQEIESYTKIALKFLTFDQWIFILGEEKINPFHVLPEAKKMIENMVEKGSYEKAASSLLNFMDDLPDTYNPILKKIWENVGAEFVEAHLDLFSIILQRQRNEDKDKQSESQIFQLIVTMLKEYDLKTVFEKLLPLQKALPHSLLFRKLYKMMKLLEDPDRMMELGDYYAEFKQYDPAIDCYSWEMELKPQDPDPVWRICKMYQQKGMAAEAAAYQKVFAQLKEIQESI
jgi:tetratricopeptide (TPR) repeat protein